MNRNSATAHIPDPGARTARLRGNTIPALETFTTSIRNKGAKP